MCDGGIYLFKSCVHSCDSGRVLLYHHAIFSSHPSCTSVLRAHVIVTILTTSIVQFPGIAPQLEPNIMLLHICDCIQYREYSTCL